MNEIGSSQNPDDIIAQLDALLGGDDQAPAHEESSPLRLVAPPPEPISLPRETAPIPVAAAPEPAPKSAGRILVVEDNKDYRDVVKFLLEQNSYEVVVASDGADGVNKALESEPDLVLLDFNMPQMNGYEVVKALKGNFETRKIPVIMFTGAPNRKHIKAMGLEINDFLEKPVPNARLLGAVMKALNKEGAVMIGASEAEEAASAAAQSDALRDSKSLDAGMVDDDVVDDNVLVDLESEKKAEEHEDSRLEVLANDSPLISQVNKIMVHAVRLGASDIHIEPQERQLLVRVRVNGSLQKLCSLPAGLTARLTARVKIMSNLVITERRRPQDGQFRATIAGKKVEFRVSTLPCAHGEKIVLRILGGSKIKNNLSELGFSERDRDCVEQAIQNPHGLLLVTGPTGSGKTTTLYTMVKLVSKPDVNVMTAEDPIEYEMPEINQVHVKPAIGLTFESVLRSFLRQDPDVMLVGEIRDLETAEIAVKASITGHLVLSTLHTNSAPATITRLTHMGIAPFLVAASVKLVVAQRLIKVLCPECRVPAPLSEYDKKMLGAESDRFKEVFRGLGCTACQQTGYSGRRPLFEVMPVRTPEVRHGILTASSVDQLTELAVKEGMTSLRQAALGAVERGETSMSEALKLIVSD